MRKSLPLTSGLILASWLAFLGPSAQAQAQRSDCGIGGFQVDASPQHQQKLHDALKLTPQQEEAWKTYAQTLRQQPPGGQSGKRADWATMSAPERAEQALESTKRNEAYMTQLVSGMKTFYATLNPEQQKTFDRFHGGQQTDQR